MQGRKYTCKQVVPFLAVFFRIFDITDYQTISFFFFCLGEFWLCSKTWDLCACKHRALNEKTSCPTSLFQGLLWGLTGSSATWCFSELLGASHVLKATSNRTPVRWSEGPMLLAGEQESSEKYSSFLHLIVKVWEAIYPVSKKKGGHVASPTFSVSE